MIATISKQTSAAAAAVGTRCHHDAGRYAREDGHGHRRAGAPRGHRRVAGLARRAPRPRRRRLARHLEGAHAAPDRRVRGGRRAGPVLRVDRQHQPLARRRALDDVVRPAPARQRLGALEQAAHRAAGGVGSDGTRRARADRRRQGRRVVDDARRRRGPGGPTRPRRGLRRPPRLPGAVGRVQPLQASGDARWVAEAKRPATRNSRVAQIAERAAVGEVAFPRTCSRVSGTS